MRALVWDYLRLSLFVKILTISNAILVPFVVMVSVLVTMVFRA